MPTEVFESCSKTEKWGLPKIEVPFCGVPFEGVLFLLGRNQGGGGILGNTQLSVGFHGLGTLGHTQTFTSVLTVVQ